MAVQLFLTAVGLYEQSMFVVQPASHPPAASRWHAIVRDRISRWADDLDTSTLGSAELVRALSDLAESPRRTDAAVVYAGLGERLDRPLWSFRDWSAATVVGHYLLATSAQAMEALRRWPGWPDGTDVSVATAEVVGAVFASAPARGIVRAAVSGNETVGRLDAVKALATVSDAVNGQPSHTEPFPSWAIAIIVLDAIASARSAIDSQDGGTPVPFVDPRC
jgi:hypothetical protein